MQIIMDPQTRHELAVWMALFAGLFLFGNMALTFIEVIRYYHGKKKDS